MKHLFFAGIFLINSIDAYCQIQDKSELAKIMAQMLQYLKTEKVNIEKNKSPKAVPVQFAKISTAQPTNGKRLLPDHQQQSDNFLKLLHSYSQEKNPLSRKQKFNLVVNGCVSCHQHVCPGPIAAIEQNFIGSIAGNSKQ